MVKKSKTWIRRNELETLLIESTEFDNENTDKAMQWFTRMERWLSQRFRQRVRGITLTCAIVVTFLFQVNTPELLKRLSVNPKMRIGAAQIALDHMFSEQAGISYQPNLQMVAVLALQQFQENHPQYQETLEAVSGTGDRIENLVHELSIVLEDSEHKEALLSEYEEMILSEVRKLAAANADKAVESLALIDITPLSRGWNYYAKVSNLFGMLMTFYSCSVLFILEWFTMEANCQKKALNSYLKCFRASISAARSTAPLDRSPLKSSKQKSLVMLAGGLNKVPNNVPNKQLSH